MCDILLKDQLNEEDWCCFRHALDILISLARIFPSYFVPGKPNSGASSVTSSPPKPSKTPRTENNSGFWDLLIRLDTLSASKKVTYTFSFSRGKQRIQA